MQALNDTVAFKVTAEDYDRIKKLTRVFKLSEALRVALRKILDEEGV